MRLFYQQINVSGSALRSRFSFTLGKTKGLTPFFSCTKSTKKGVSQANIRLNSSDAATNKISLESFTLH